MQKKVIKIISILLLVAPCDIIFIQTITFGTKHVGNINNCLHQ